MTQRRTRYVLSSAQPQEAVNTEIVKLLDISEEETMDNSNSDLLPMRWTAPQLLVKVIDGKPPSPLEVMTLSFVAYAFIVYLFYIDHSQEVRMPSTSTSTPYTQRTTFAS